MDEKQRESERGVGRADHNPAGAERAAKNPDVSGQDLAKTGADDRGGSRDGEKVEGDAGDRDQLDHDGGR